MSVNALVIRAACGDVHALTDIARRHADHDIDAVQRLSALLCCDPDPHPLALMTVVSLQENAPGAIQDAALRTLEQATSMLAGGAASDLRAALRGGLARVFRTLIRRMAVIDQQVVAAGLQLAIATRDAHVAHGILEGIGDIGARAWQRLPKALRDALLDSAGSEPRRAMRGVVAVWIALDEEERQRIARATARDPSSAADLLAWIGARRRKGVAVGLGDATSTARAMLLDAVCADPAAAARGGGAVWDELSSAERQRIASAAAGDPTSASALIKRLGARRWRTTSITARAQLIDAVCADPAAAARGGGAVWRALSSAEQARVCASSARLPFAAAFLLTRIGRKRARPSDRPIISALIDSVVGNSWLTAWGGGAVWRALDENERMRVASTAAARRESLFELTKRIGTKGWRGTPPRARAVLLDAVQNDPWAAAAVGGSLWLAMHDAERARIAESVVRDSDATDALLFNIGPAGWSMTPAAMRTKLLAALCNKPWGAPRCLDTIWRALPDEDRRLIARTVVRDPGSVPVLLEGIAARCRSPRDAAWVLAPADVRTLLFDAIIEHSERAWCGRATWAIASESERARIARSAARRAESAVNLMRTLGSAMWKDIPEDARTALLAAISESPWHAAQGGGVIWPALNDEERSRVVQAAAQDKQWANRLILTAIAAGADPTSLLAHVDRLFVRASEGDAASAVSIILALNTACDPDHRQTLLRVALVDREASLAVAQALHAGASWRSWMQAFAPDANADADLKDAWCDHARHLAPDLAAAQPMTRRPQR